MYFSVLIMLILKPYIFNKYTDVIAGVSTKIGAERQTPYFFNMSFSVGDDENIVKENRNLFFENLGIKPENIAYQKQIHEDKISFVTQGGLIGESDAMITDKPGIGLAVSIADCVPILVYDPVKKIIAGVHSGWRGTEKKILLKTLGELKKLGCLPENLVAYIGPSISKNIYEVGKEVAEFFDEKYLEAKGEKYLLDVAGVNFDILFDAGVKKNNIQLSSLCTYAMKDVFHSYRRDGNKSGRSYAVIALREN
jgi:purine-nucleoside/S-methyl-5'-thioadenosine phosphorylase / adenosine deaminase